MMIPKGLKFNGGPYNTSHSYLHIQQTTCILYLYPTMFFLPYTSHYGKLTAIVSTLMYCYIKFWIIPNLGPTEGSTIDRFDCGTSTYHVTLSLHHHGPVSQPFGAFNSDVKELHKLCVERRE